MLPTNLQFGRVRGDDRFYVPVKARKNQNQKQQQQQPQQRKQKQAEAAKIDENESIISPESEALKKAASAQSVVSVSNLDRFLKSTTPSVPAQYFSKVLFFLVILLISFLSFNCCENVAKLEECSIFAAIFNYA